MIGFYEGILGEQATLTEYGSLTGLDWRWVSTAQGLPTITPSKVAVRRSEAKSPRVKRGVEFSVAFYDNLLRRLAD